MSVCMVCAASHAYACFTQGAIIADQLPGRLCSPRMPWEVGKKGEVRMEAIVRHWNSFDKNRTWPLCKQLKRDEEGHVRRANHQPLESESLQVPFA